MVPGLTKPSFLWEFSKEKLLQMLKASKQKMLLEGNKRAIDKTMAKSNSGL